MRAGGRLRSLASAGWPPARFSPIFAFRDHPLSGIIQVSSLTNETVSRAAREIPIRPLGRGCTYAGPEKTSTHARAVTTSCLVLDMASKLSRDAGAVLSRDPIGYENGNSLYVYVRGAPLNHTDPKGLALGPGIGAAVAYTRTAGHAPRFMQQPDSRSEPHSNCAMCIGTCEKMVDRIQGESNLPTIIRAWIYATPIGWFCGPGGYCHDWSIKFGGHLQFHAKDRGTFLNVTQHTLDLRLWSTGFEDHNLHIVKNVCTGKCLVVQNAGAPGGQIVDPCSIGYDRDDFEGDGWTTWQAILRSCRCSE